MWTPVADRIPGLTRKFNSDQVISTTVAELRERLLDQEICMLFLLIDAPQDRLQTYQHHKPSSFVTNAGVDKLTGAREIAAAVGFDLAASIGAGDTEMDVFLSGTGLAVHVGALELKFRGKLETVRLRSSFELGDMLFPAGGADGLTSVAPSSRFSSSRPAIEPAISHRVAGGRVKPDHDGTRHAPSVVER